LSAERPDVAPSALRIFPRSAGVILFCIRPATFGDLGLVLRKVGRGDKPVDLGVLEEVGADGLTRTGLDDYGILSGGG
jgi:hypothetical protein